jgi:two-component system, LuxR family, sensor kinase FixL
MLLSHIGNIPWSKRRRETLGAAMLLLALALLYYLGVRVGLAFTPATSAVSLLWPPNAIVLAALLLWPVRFWAWPLLAILPAHLIAQVPAGVPLVMAGSWYASNVSEALLGAAIIRGILGAAPRFDRVRDVSVYLIAAVTIAPVLTSFLDAALVALVGWRYGGDYWAVVRTRLPSNVLAAIIVPPFMIIALRDAPALLRRVSRARLVEGTALLALLCAVSLAVFHEVKSSNSAALFAYAPLPLLIWATVRTGVVGVTTCIAIVALLSITGTVQGTGPFALAEPGQSVLALQIFLIVTASTLMLLAAALAEVRQAQAVALRREARLDLALTAAHMGAWEWDMLSDRISWRLAAHSGAIVSQNSESLDELLERVHRNDRHRLLAAMRAAREEGGAGEVECRFDCDGRLRWIRALGKVQRAADGQSLAMIGVCIDTTQHKSVEIQQRSQREKLAHLARSATLGELSGALAHEISQPLAAILLNARAAQQEVLKESPDMQELGAIIADIAADDRRASETIGRLRALFPREPAEMEQVRIEECILSILALEHSDLIARNVTVDLHIDAALPPVAAAQAQLQQVLLNLIVNACEAMAEQSTERRLRIVARHHAGEVHVEVSDTGSGVDDFESIFRPLFSTRPHNVGLGLAIARTIVAAHGGRLWGVNNPAGGATFFIALPALAEA